MRRKEAAPARQPATPRDTSWEDLRAAIRRAHDPRVVLYWNRSLSHRVVTTDWVTTRKGYERLTTSNVSTLEDRGSRLARELAYKLITI